jgi:protein O-GlcNAc transferase
MRAGTAAANRNDLPAARREFARAAQLAPQVAAAHAAYGSILLALGELDAARRELQRAHSLGPSDFATTLNLARTESLLGHSASSVSLFREALAVSPQPVLSEDESLAYAAALSATGDQTSAESELRAALTRSPNSAALYDAHGMVLANTGHLQEALDDLTRAITLAPTATLQYHLGAVLISLGRPDEALPPLRSAAQSLPNSFDIHLQLGRALSALHQDAPALAELHRAIELQPTTLSPTQAYALALALEASGDARASLPFFTIAARSPSLGNEPLINQAVALVQTGDAIGALPLYAKALALGPETPTLREDYGVAYLQQSDLDHAIAQFRSGLLLDPQSAHLHYDLGLAFKLKDDLPQAIPELERASQLDPNLPDPAYTLGILYMQQGRTADAATQLSRATTLQPTNAEAWSVLASVLKDSDPAGAIAALHQAISLGPDQPGLHIQLAALYAHAGDPAQAAAERKIAADLSRAAMAQQRATFALNSGRALLAQGKLPEAIAQLTVAAEADPALPDPHKLLAEALARQGKPAEAQRERERANALTHPAATPQ